MSKASLELGGTNWGTKDGNLLAYAQGNESSNLVPREFTFTRGSDIAATRINSSGLIEKYRENLLLQSNQFDTTWTGNPSNRSITSGFLGYDGSNDAWKLEAVSDNNYSVVNQVVSSTGVETFSVYAKAGTSNFFRIQITGGTNTSASYFDLSGSGAVGNNFNEIDAKIESIGNGWFRCSVTGNKTTSSTCVIYVIDADGSTDVTTGKNIYIQDAQLEAGLVATSYLESGATKATSGVADNEPRINYAGGTASLLLEPQRTNTFGNSEYFGSGYNNLVTLESNSTISPDGTQNASKIVSSQTASGPKFANFGGVAAGASQNQTFSLFVKNYNHRYIQLINNGAAPLYANFDIQDGVIGNYGSGTTASIEDYGNGWYRCTIVCDGSQNNINNACRVYLADSLTQGYANATNVALGNGVYIWGAMQENNSSYPTSYIPTYGTSDTRAADDVNDFDVSSILTGSNFTWFLDLNDYIGSDINQEFIFLGGFVNIQLRVRPDGYRFYYNNIAGGSVYPIAGSTTANKFCVSYDGNNYRLYVDGVLQATTASVGDSGWDFIKNTTGASLPLKEMQLFSTVLTDAECIALTTL